MYPAGKLSLIKVMSIRDRKLIAEFIWPAYISKLLSGDVCGSPKESSSFFAFR